LTLGDPATHPGVLVVFAKDPQPGFVKTRMTPALSPELAASFYREMLADVLEESSRACAALGLLGVLAVTPATAMGRLAVSAPKCFKLVAQVGSDLGSRMAHEVASALAMGMSRVLLRGSDSPALGLRDLEELVIALDKADLAVSPDLDGGYSAIGLRRPAREIFDHPMSTTDVLRDTLARAKSAGLSTCTTEGSFDLDTLEDLRHLARVRDSLPKERCPRTLAFADAHGLWTIAS